MEEFVPPEVHDSLRTQGGAVVSDVRGAVLQFTRHVEALAELLQLELQEYGHAQVRRLVLLALGAVLLLLAYVFLCLVGILVCACVWGAVGAFSASGGVVVVNLSVGLWALHRGMKHKPEGIAPATCSELKDDLQCIKLYLKGKEES